MTDSEEIMTGSGPRIALITGANKGLGAETARRLGKLGLTVIVGARNPQRGQAASKELRASGADVHCQAEFPAAPGGLCAQALVGSGDERDPRS